MERGKRRGATWEFSWVRLSSNIRASSRALFLQFAVEGGDQWVKWRKGLRVEGWRVNGGGWRERMRESPMREGLGINSVVGI